MGTAIINTAAISAGGEVFTRTAIIYVDAGNRIDLPVVAKVGS